MAARWGTSVTDAVRQALRAELDQLLTAAAITPVPREKTDGHWALDRAAHRSPHFRSLGFLAEAGTAESNEPWRACRGGQKGGLRGEIFRVSVGSDP